MLQHDHHECACKTSLTFAYTAVVFEVLLLTASKMPVTFVARDWYV